MSEMLNKSSEYSETVLNNNVTVIHGLAGTGKTSVVSGVLEALNNYSSVMCALSGRAASRMSEITGKTGYTIHRLLGYPKGDSEHQFFEFNQDSKLPYNLYILDEISMVDSKIFYYLLRAIPDGAKLICLGDSGQLEAIGCGNVAYDMIHSSEIPTIELTKIHRQAAKSAIITQSIAVRNSKQIVGKDWVGNETRGELKDLEIHCYSDSSNTFYEVMEIFSKLMAQKDFDIMDCQIIVPIKTRGDACTYKINNTIQELYNPASKNKKEITRLSNNNPFILREGDKVINTINNYRLKTPIYNGNIGTIKSISYNEELDSRIITIDFIGIGNVDIPEDVWNGIELGYAITVHKYQGSQSKYVIFGLDFSSYALLTRELIYTGITRAQKKCYLICQTGALRYATAQQAVSTKQTHLQDCLYEVAHPKLIF